MSRIGKNPVVLPAGVEITIADQITVKGPLGTLKTAAHPAVKVVVEGQNVGVSKVFERKLQLVGVGYRAQAAGDTLNLSLGFSHPVAHKMPAGVKVECPTQTEIVLKGADKQQVGQVAAEIRAYRKPEPYKGKGVRYSDEVVVIKETKKK